MKKKYKVVFSAEALLDLNEARDWYNLQQKNLGEEFVQEITILIQNIVANPLLYAIKYDTIRTGICKVFPYAVHYELDENSYLISIISIFHFSRRPTWLN